MKILICPLNWGLGHASRDIVIIRKLQAKGHKVVIAADGSALEFLRNEFPQLDYIPFPSSVKITYFRSLPAWLKILIISPVLGYETLREHYHLKSIVKKTQADLVISDSRFGLWHTQIPSVLITHQLYLKFPRFMKFLEKPVAGMIRKMIKQFHRCWIPDHPGEKNLTGELSHKYRYPDNVVFIGPLSRFTENQKSGEQHSERETSFPPTELVILISGPEPQRTKLENIILEQIVDFPGHSIILRGIPGEVIRHEAGPRSTMFSHLPSDMIRTLLANSRYIICRGGYTTIMDLVALGRTAMIIPTPGQTEQEYLADYLSNKSAFLAMDQKKLDLMDAIRQLDGFQSLPETPGSNLLEEELDQWF